MREGQLQQQLAQFMRVQFKGVMFRSDFAAGIKMNMGQAIKHKSMQEGKSYPDFFIAHASRGYHGCFLELKHESNYHLPYLKTGVLSKYAPIQAQAGALQRLHKAGYHARFAVGFEQAVMIINWYMDNRLTNEPAHDNGRAVHNAGAPF